MLAGSFDELAALECGAGADERGQVRAFTRGVHPERQEVIESTFQGRGYWVQTISDSNGGVLLYSVTSCDKSFKPKFSFLNGSVTLNESTFASVGKGPLGASEARNFVSGATANSNFIDIAYGGNPGGYKTYMWGIDDACFSWVDYSEDLSKADLLPFDDDVVDYRGSPSRAGIDIHEFRHRAVVNTYAETAVGVELRDIGDFQIGVDRIKVRTVAR